MREIIVYILLLIPFFVGNFPALKSSEGKDQNKEASIRIKRKCGIPDNVEWSYATKMKYGKQIEKVIREMN
jgi:hypothetical protein